MSHAFAITITLVILTLDAALIAIIFITKVAANRKQSARRKREEQLERQISLEDIDLEAIAPEDLMPIYVRLRETVELPRDQQDYMMRLLLDSHLPRRYLAKLRSRFRLKRIEAAANLRYLESSEIQQAMLVALKKEHDHTVVMYLCQVLAIQRVPQAITPMVAKIRTATPWMAKRLRAILCSYKGDFLRYATRHLGNTRRYMQILICTYAATYPAEELRAYVVEHAQSKHPAVRSAALKALLAYYPEELTGEPFVSSINGETLATVVQALAEMQDSRYIPTILSFSRRPRLHGHIVQGLSEMTYRDPALLTDILERFKSAEDGKQKELLAQVLDNRIDYFLSRINGPGGDQVKDLLHVLVKENRTNGIIFFLSRNRDRAIEESIVSVLQPLVAKHPRLKAQILQYLDDRLVRKFRVTAKKNGEETPEPHSDPPQRLRLAILLTAVLLAFPVLLLASEFPVLISLSWREIGKLYVVRFNYLFVFYSAAVNMMYLAVLAVSLRGARVQARLWNSKDSRFLFTKDLLPSVSIIAPAYNESANIIESTNSLLNQRYPDFELIIVNDGSKDETLNTLIDYFDLEKRDRLIRRRLHTRPIRGIYTNKNIPNLIVVDKVNGGKADSLNLGLNVANKEFFCGIDADSLLEPDALLRAVSVMIDSKNESIAAGGNIYPVNGCTVDRGFLEQVSLPKNFLARLQSLEYLRAFMAGRVGWAHMNLLLIISGAFGIFNRERTVATGGYLTKSGRYHRDTVGEDMELVVRLSRHMRELNKPYKVHYAFNANCWTEVPETWKALHRQRDRWHRGLIDILLFHSAMIANPRYGRLGMVGMPYYFLFECIGPFIEAQGLLMVLISALIGALNIPTALLLFTATILMGILVSVSSVAIGQLDRDVYDARDILRLLGMAVVENFGIRQIISFWRVTGFFSAMRKNRGWGSQTRKGFAARSVTAKE